MAELIGSVQITPGTVAPGESARVEVLNPSGQPYPASGDVIISIDGVRAASRYFQFATTGTRTVTVSAIGRGQNETTTATIEVKGAPLVYHRTLPAAGQLSAPGLIPFITLRSDPSSPYRATFMLATPPAAAAAAAAALAASSGSSATPATSSTDATTISPAVRRPSFIPRIPQAALAAPQLSALTSLQKQFPNTISAGSMRLSTPIEIVPLETRYVWSFGDGLTATTSSPVVTHDYFAAIAPDRIAFPFDVECRILHDNITVTRTLVLYSAYGMCRVNGGIVPPVSGDTFATLSGDGASFSASLLVSNIEETELTIDHLAIVPVTDDLDAAFVPPAFARLAQPVVIARKSSALVAVQTKRSDLAHGSGKPVTGFIAFFRGQLSAATATPRVVQPVAVTPGRPLGTPGSLPPVHPTAGGASVRFSRHLRIRLQDQVLPARSPFGRIHTKLVDINLRVAPGLPPAAVRADAITVDPTARVVGVPLTTFERVGSQMAQVRHTVLAALAGITE